MDVTRQISAIQSSLERVNRVMLHNRLETCFSTAVLDGRSRRPSTNSSTRSSSPRR
ncbi:metal-sensing transcriptional repressor [Nocardiopsis tropica]|uniref:metal-sensing transcriptional repressor n=1 Tax=Nocardiopsis tropica TaxID=109330 RepID=UPI0038B3BA10